MHLLPILSLLPLTLSTGPSTIVLPVKGTHLVPLSTFPFQYEILADYCQSSYNFSVYLFTSHPTSFRPAQTWATGHYYGRYSIDNYPGNPYPVNPRPPAELPVPDFRRGSGGFETGQVAVDKKVWLVVLEETGTCEASVGDRLALNWVELVYNATSGGKG